MDDLDNAMDVMDALEERERRSRPGQRKVLIGSVEHFFDKINVVAIKLSGSLKVGDVIEIGDENSSVKQRILSMQIDRRDVDQASEGDAVGIKLDNRVRSGSSVYKIG